MFRLTRSTPLVCFAVLAAVLIGQIGVAAAAPVQGQRDNATIERTLQAQLRRIKVQDQRLKRADQFAGTVDRVTQQQKSQGRDVSQIERALASYRKGIADARTAWNTANDLLKKPAGFDASGKVTDAAQAQNSLRESHAAMQKVSRLAWNAARDLRSALGRYRSATPGFVPPAFPQMP
jgi:hypothetical protein